MTAPEDITPAELDAAEQRAAKHTDEGLDRACAALSWHGIVLEVLKLSATQTRLIAALRKRDAENAKLQAGITSAVNQYCDFERETKHAVRERDAAKALLARAEIMLRSAANDPQCRLFEYRGRFAALLAEIEAEHGKP